jgi:hypothetical protein
MSSETETEQNNKQQHTVVKSGLKLFGYIVPWWVVILVIVILIYILHILYVDGYLFGTSNSTRTNVSVLSDSTPDNIKKLIGGTIHWN